MNLQPGCFLLILMTEKNACVQEYFHTEVPFVAECMSTNFIFSPQKWAE
jgi:hypothetical protein